MSPLTKHHYCSETLMCGRCANVACKLWFTLQRLVPFSDEEA